MFKKTPLILALGLALATQAGAQVVVTPSEGTQIVTGSVESDTDITTLFGNADTSNVHLTFNDNVFSQNFRAILPGEGNLTLVSKADGNFITGPVKINNKTNLTIIKESATGAIFAIDHIGSAPRDKIIINTGDVDQDNLPERPNSMRLTNSGGSVFDVTAPTDWDEGVPLRYSLDSDHYYIESTAEDAPTIKAKDLLNIGQNSTKPLKAGLKFEQVSDSLTTPTDLTLKGVKTAIDLDNTALRTALRTVDITGTVLLKNNAHAIFGALEDEETSTVPSEMFNSEAYVDAQKLQSLGNVFVGNGADGWHEQSLTIKGTQKSPTAIDATDSHILGNAATITIAAGTADGKAIDLKGSSTAAFFSKDSMTVKGNIAIAEGATLAIRSQGTYAFDGELNNQGKLFIDADTLTGSGNNAKLVNQGTTTIKVAKAATFGGGLETQSGELALAADSVQVAGPMTVGADTTLDVSAKTMNVAKTIENQGGTLSLTTDKLVASESANFSQGTTTLSTKELTVAGDITLGGADTQLEITQGSLQAKNVSVSEGAQLGITTTEGSKVVANIKTDESSSVAMELAPKASFAGTLEATPSSVEGKGVAVSLNDGASLSLTGTSSVNNLTVNGGTIDLGESHLEVEKTVLKSDQLNLKASSLENARLAVETLQKSADGPLNVNVDLFDAEIPAGSTDEIIDQTTGMVEIDTIQNASGKTVDTPIQIEAQDGLHDISIVTDGAGNVTKVTVKADPVITAARDVTSSQMMAWRTQINDVNKRLGDLRTYGEQSYGGWVRLYGAKSKLKSSSVTSKSNTVQVGFDTKINDHFYVGVTGLYSDGESRVTSGTSDDKSYGFGIYGGWLADNGQFVDVILKQFRVNSDMNFVYRNGVGSTSEYSAWGTSLSAEYGWRIGLTESKRFWIEPQAELSYGRLGGDTYASSAGVVTDQDSITSVIGRLGVALGTTFEKGSAYVKASVAHDWDGETSAVVTRKGRSTTVSQDLGGTWGEFAFGGTVNFTKNFAGYAEFQTSTGSKIKTPYQWNLGARYLF